MTFDSDFVTNIQILSGEWLDVTVYDIGLSDFVTNIQVLYG